MTYAELSQMKTTDMTTNCVIDDILNNGRFCFGRKGWKRAFESEKISSHDLDNLMFWARKAGIEFPVALEVAFAGLKTAVNKYGETTELHGPVCFECHQRMNVARITSLRGIDNVQVCLHCKPFEKAAA